MARSDRAVPASGQRADLAAARRSRAAPRRGPRAGDVRARAARAARVRSGRTGGAALETTATRAIKRGARRWIVGAAIAAGAAGAVALALWGFARTPGSGGGALAVKQPTHVELGEASSVDLEASTELVWHREAH